MSMKEDLILALLKMLKYKPVCTRLHVDECNPDIIDQSKLPVEVIEGNWTKFKLDPFQIFNVVDKKDESRNYLDVFKERLNEETKVVVIELSRLNKGIVEYAHSIDVKVIAYFSASYEDWRTDEKFFPRSAIGDDMEEWDDEKWGNFTKVELRDFLELRMKKAKELGCDGIEIDNMDIYAPKRDHGFTRPSEEQVIHAIVDLSSRCRALGMGYFLKNSPEISNRLSIHLDGVMSESAIKWKEYDGHQKVIDAGKPVFNIEYRSKYLKPIKGLITQYKSDDYFETEYEVAYYESPEPSTQDLSTLGNLLAYNDRFISGDTSSDLDELSGLAVSLLVLDTVYTHNDSGDKARFFSMSLKGRSLKEIKIEGVSHKDFEDIACGLYDHNPCVFIADIGDNSESRSHIKIHIVNEGDILEEQKVHPVKTLELKYPDGPRNAEGLAVHPDGTIYIVSKRYSGDPAGLYRVVPNKQVMQKVGDIELDELFPKIETVVTGFDISPSGKKILLITNENIVEFEIDLSEYITTGKTVWSNSPRQVVMPGFAELQQQESIAYVSENHFIYSSEGGDQPIVNVRVKND